MPVSKSKRKKRGRGRRPPAVQTPAKPKGTPRWVPPAFFGLLAAGVIVIIVNYMRDEDFSGYILLLGLGLMGASFAVATKLR